MRTLKTILCASVWLLVAGCGSRVNAPLCQPLPKPPAPPAWAMMPASNSLQVLDQTFSISGQGLSETRQP
ncbi:lysis system o-spanin lipoprotein Rz1 [Enterobacteriaceae bacterium ESL0689]|nr:lysis system o-spanin lipoprotein Rz1 [Enterobacteriaceae bacterium ESL0689]